MFYCATGLTSAEFLILPATALTNNCYNYTFGYCTAMQRGPKVLPAETLKNYCYSYMYYCCYALLTAPIICATTLANYCMEYMFRKCTSLTKGPVLLAPTLKTNCYRYMFYQSSKVNYVKCLATTVTGTTNWLNSVSSTGTFVAARSDVAWSEGVGGIPTGWTRENIIEVETT